MRHALDQLVHLFLAIAVLLFAIHVMTSMAGIGKTTTEKLLRGYFRLVWRLLTWPFRPLGKHLRKFLP
jgi:hypothetical protein